MDRRLQQLRRRAASGDPEAGVHLAYAECRMGEHILRDDQIVLSDDPLQSQHDAGCCQCSQKLYDSVELCELGHHRPQRLYHFNQPENEAERYQYWCVRSRIRDIREVFQPDFPRGIRNPLQAVGCSYHLDGIEACRQGFHFVGGPQENLQDGLFYRNCEVEDCHYKEMVECPNRQHDLHWRPEVDTATCRRCTRSFQSRELCNQGHHFPDYMMLHDCIREECNLYQKGTSLYKALAESYKRTGKLEAICRMGNRTIAKASGWDRKLGKYGVKKPRLDSEERKKRSSKWWKFVNPRQRLTVQYSNQDPRENPQYNRGYFNLPHRAEYADIKSELKTRWNGYWYPLPGN